MVPNTKVNIRNLTILTGSTLTVLVAAILAPALPEMAEVFQDVPNAEFLVRLTMTIPALFIALSAPFMGILLDRWGRKPVLLLSLILYGVAGTAGFALESLYAILVSRAILGIAVSGVMTGFTTLIGDYFTGTRLNRFMGYQGAAIGLGGIVFVLLGGYLADIGWRYPFLIHLGAFFVLPGVWLAIDEPKIQVQSHEGSKKSASFPMRLLAPIYAIAFAGMLVFFVFPVQLPFYLIDQVGSTPGQVGLALALQALVAVLFAVQYHKLKARFSFESIFGIIFLTLGINHIIIFLFPEYGLVLVGLLIGGIGLGVLPPNINVWVVSITHPTIRGRALSGLTASLFMGQFFAPIFTQPMVDQVDLAGMFGIVGIISVLLAFVFVLITIRRRKQSPDLQDPIDG
jgi:MFS family permease